MTLLVFTEPKYRHEEEKEGGLQGCHVCGVRTEVKGHQSFEFYTY